ncbi:MAG: disulfide reductase, partial [Candidatus Sabulitectum sp.]|nr:disulfide reductase [Candidatus Sabulitectum sp.]
ILSAAMVPESDLNDLAGIAGIQLDSHGFIKRAENGTGSMETTKVGIFVAGSAQGPMDIQKSVIQAESAAGQIMKIMSEPAGEQNNESALGS